MSDSIQLDSPADGGEARGESAHGPSRERVQVGYAHSPIGMFLADPDGVLRDVNPAFCDLMGCGADALVGVSLTTLLGAGGTRDRYREELEQLLQGATEAVMGEWRLEHVPPGSSSWLHLTLTRLRDETGGTRYLLGQAFDASDDHRRRESLLRAVHLDPLTGVANRGAVLERLRSELARSRRAADRVALAFGDLDNFKLVNDSLGHEAGNRVLRLVADRLRESLRSDDLVGRVGGDEFVVVLRGVSSVEDAVRVAQSLLEIIQVDARISGHRVVPGISLGVALAEPESTPEELLRQADMAMYRAKDAGGGRVVVFDEQMQAESTARFQLEEAIREGLDGQEFTTWYQPILSLDQQDFFGVEALARWIREDGLEVPAREFIGVAVDSRTIHRIGALVVEGVARFMEHASLPGGLVTMNVTAEEIRAGSTLDRIEAAIREERLDPTRLGMELEESTTAGLTGACRRRILDVIDRGAKLLLDNFGTGFSSIAHLRDLPIYAIKLAPTFVANVESESDYKLAEAVARFAECLGAVRIAEGIETEAQEQALRRMGWPIVQGFRYGPAKPLSAWIR